MNALLAVVELLLLVSVGASLVTYCFFWYENAWSVGHEPERRSKLRSMAFSGLLSSIVSMVFVMASYPFGLFRRFWEPKEICATEPVIILTHGLYHNASAWVLFANRLRKAGFKNIFVMNYRSFFTSFEKTLRKFEKFVTDAMQTVPGQPVYLIGHSLGGLLSRVYAENAKDGAVPAAVITLGTPHQGSKLAAFGLGKLAYGLLYRGPLYTKIQSGPARLPCSGVAFFSPVDNMVFPFEGLKVPYPGWVYYQTAPLSHIAMIYSRTIAEEVIEILHGKTISQ